MVLQKSMSNDDLDTSELKKRDFTPLEITQRDAQNDTLSQKDPKKDALKIKYQKKFQKLNLSPNLHFRQPLEKEQTKKNPNKHLKHSSQEMKDKNDSYILRR